MSERPWLVYLIEDPYREWARYVGTVRATDKKAAKQAAVDQFDLAPGERGKLYIGSSKPYVHAPDPHDLGRPTSPPESAR